MRICSLCQRGELRQKDIRTYHDHRDGEQYPPTAAFISEASQVSATASTYNRAGSLWIVCTTGLDILPEESEMRALKGDRKVLVRVLRCLMMQVRASSHAAASAAWATDLRRRLP